VAQSGYKVLNPKNGTINWQTPTGTWSTLGTTTGTTIRFLDPEDKACFAHGAGVGELGCGECEEVHRANEAARKHAWFGGYTDQFHNLSNTTVTLSASFNQFTSSMYNLMLGINSLVVPTRKVPVKRQLRHRLKRRKMK
jgi:hypothetical protein